MSSSGTLRLNATIRQNFITVTKTKRNQQNVSILNIINERI